MGAQGIMGEQTAPAGAAVSASSGRFQVLRGHPVACSREAVGGSEGEGSISVWEPVCGCRAAAHARGKALEQTEGGCKASVVGTVVSRATIGCPVADGGGSSVPSMRGHICRPFASRAMPPSDSSSYASKSEQR
jgi:hypothetical protein